MPPEPPVYEFVGGGPLDGQTARVPGAEAGTEYHALRPDGRGRDIYVAERRAGRLVFVHASA